MSLSRRQFLRATGAAGALAAATKLGSGVPAAATTLASPRPAGSSKLPAPRDSGIEHIVVLCMENRSFDHFLGWVPGANGKQAGLSYPDDSGVMHPTHRLTEWTGCGFNDPDHSYGGGRVQLDGGKCDGFRRGNNDDFALGYYTGQDLAMYSSLVQNFTVCDQWFCSILGPTYPNRFYTHAAQTDRIANDSTTSVLPTIWDRLVAAGVPANYFFSDLPFLALWGTKYAGISRPFDTFFAMAETGTLPAYSYLDPFFLGEDQGGSNDDHPHADIRRGQALVSQVVQALAASPLWSKTVLVVTYDEWGGFFDHVRPPRLPDEVDNPGGDENNPDHAQAGFRVPAFVVSPFARSGQVAHTQFDHTSILKMVEWRFGLAPLTKRDAAANNLAAVLDFSAPNARAPQMPVVLDPGPHGCVGGTDAGMSNEEPFWEELAGLPAVAAYQWVA